MENEESIRKHIAILGYDFDELSEKIKKYLEQIETSILEVIYREEEARKLLTRNHLSINSISDKSNISRQTLYSNSILKEYIVLRETEFKKNDISFNTQEQKEYIKELSNQIKLMQIRDSEIEELKVEISTLKEKLKEKDKELIRAKERINSCKS